MTDVDQLVVGGWAELGWRDLLGAYRPVLVVDRVDLLVLLRFN